MGSYFGCGLPGHIAKDCLILQKKAEKTEGKGQARIQESDDSRMER